VHFKLSRRTANADAGKITVNGYEF
jgi:hypothetical protein